MPALVAAATGAASGIFLALNYAPTWDAAFCSVEHIHKNVGMGAFLRGLHHWAGTAAIVLALVEAARMLWRGDYQRPHHRVWLLGIGLFVVLVGFAYTGYLLVGDERAYAGVLVLEGVARSIPGVGDAVASVVLGGDAVSSATLTRLYTMHVAVLPILLVLLTHALVCARSTTLRLALSQRAGAALGTLGLLALLGAVFPPSLGEAGGPAAGASESAKPEWFFLWVNELLTRVEGKTFLIAAVLPAALVGGALLLPYLRKAPKTSGARPELAIAGVVAAGVIVLSLMGAVRPVPESGEDDNDAGETTPQTTNGEMAPDPEFEERLEKTLRRFRCAKCHQIAGDPEGGEDGPPLPLGAEFGELYTRKYFEKKVGDPVGFWPDTGMTYPRNRKPTPEELATLARYFYGK